VSATTAAVAPQPFLVQIEPRLRKPSWGLASPFREQHDLERVAAATGVSIEESAAPGGGRRARLNRHRTAWRSTWSAAGSRWRNWRRQTLLGPINTPSVKARINQTVRPPLAPSPIFKLGHLVIQRPDFDRAAQWYMRHIGLIPSDVQVLADGFSRPGFFRLDRGDQPADHHSLAILGAPGIGLLHVSFETFDLDAVGQGHQFLRARAGPPIGHRPPYAGQPGVRLLERPRRRRVGALRRRRRHERQLSHRLSRTRAWNAVDLG